MKHFKFVFPKLASALILYAVFVAIDFRNTAEILKKTDMSASIDYAVYSNIAAISALVLAMFLVAYYRGAYSIFWAKAMEVSLDERQKALRSRLFLKAYRWMALIVFFGLMSDLQSASQDVQITATYSLFVIWISLPSILASFYDKAK